MYINYVSSVKLIEIKNCMLYQNRSEHNVLTNKHCCLYTIQTIYTLFKCIVKLSEERGPVSVTYVGKHSWRHTLFKCIVKLSEERGPVSVTYVGKHSWRLNTWKHMYAFIPRTNRSCVQNVEKVLQQKGTWKTTSDFTQVSNYGNIVSLVSQAHCLKQF